VSMTLQSHLALTPHSTGNNIPATYGIGHMCGKKLEIWCRAQREGRPAP